MLNQAIHAMREPSARIKRAFESLEEKRKNLESQLEASHERLLMRPSEEGGWSIHQVLVHLSDAETAIIQYIENKMKGNQPLKRQGVSSYLRYRLLKLLLNLPIKYKMPKQLSEPSSEIPYEEIKERFTNNRRALKKLVDSFPEELLSKLIFRHPIAGRLSLYETIGFMEDHYMHHRKQIQKILRSQGEKYYQKI